MSPQLSGDAFLDGYLEKYDQWIAEGKVPFAARVIPVGQSLEAQPWVLPGEQVAAIAAQARALAVWPCVCRSHYRRCDAPLEVCLLLDGPAETLVGRSVARPVDLGEALRVLRRADEHGLVHMGLYMPEHGLSAICSCCACCCHELQALRLPGRRERVARSEYLAETAEEGCTHCGRCVPRCPFGARVLEAGILRYRPKDCLGCGLCVSACPPGATRMIPRS